QLLHRDLQQAGQLHPQGQGGVVLVVFDGVDGLPGHPQQLGHVLLPQAPGLAQLFDPVLHTPSASSTPKSTRAAVRMIQITTSRFTRSSPTRARPSHWARQKITTWVPNRKAGRLVTPPWISSHTSQRNRAMTRNTQAAWQARRVICCSISSIFWNPKFFMACTS